MTLYSVVLFCHIAATLLVAAALFVEGLSLNRLRRSTTSDQVHLWVDLVPRLSLLFIGSLVLLLLSGIYLAEQISAWSLGWPRMAVAALLLIAPFGAVTGAKMRAIRRICRSGTANQSDLTRRVRDGYLKVSFYVRTALFLGIVFLMTARPEFMQSAAIIGLCLVLGIALGLIRSRQDFAGRKLARMEGD